MPSKRLLTKARISGNPVIEDEVATLIWQGPAAPRLIDDVHNWDESPQEMTQFAKNLWGLSIHLPPDAYLEYAFIDPKSGERIADPLNPRLVWNGINEYNHYFYMPQGKPSPLLSPGKRITRGSVTRYALATQEFAAGKQRTVYLYHPPVKTKVPLLVVYDGSDYLKRVRLNVIVDALIAQDRIRPIAMAMIQNGGPARSVEYSCSESTVGLLVERLLPLAKEHLKLESIKKGRYGIMGASLGGSMALYTALRVPHVFRKVLSQSGAFIAPDYSFVVVDLVRYAPRPDIDVWMDVGQFEWLLDGNQKMRALLKERNYRVKYREFPAGHNFTAWRDDISNGLEALYGA